MKNRPIIPHFLFLIHEPKTAGVEPSPRSVHVWNISEQRAEGCLALGLKWIFVTNLLFLEKFLILQN